MRTPGNKPVKWATKSAFIRLQCERCDVLRSRLYVTPWGLLCLYCQSHAEEEVETIVTCHGGL